MPAVLVANLVKDTKKTIREVDDQFLPDKVKRNKLESLFKKVLDIQPYEISSLASEGEDILVKLYIDVSQKCIQFLNNPAAGIQEGRDLCLLILELNRYLADFENTPWKLGCKSRAWRQFSKGRF